MLSSTLRRSLPLNSLPRISSTPIRSLSTIRPLISSSFPSPSSLLSLHTRKAGPLGGNGIFGGLNARGIQTTPVIADGGQGEIPHEGVGLDSDHTGRPDLHPPPAPGDDFNVMMIGAGNIMFGSDEGPWNHSFRIEHKLGPRLKVVALIDPSVARAEAVLAGKRASFVESAYRDTVVYKSIEEFREVMTKDKEPKAIIVGSPPAYRGGTNSKNNLEVKLLKLFPNSAFFVEKPVSAGPVDEAHAVTDALVKSENIVSVGYMLRYLRCVQKMKQIIFENNLTVMGTVARYACAYEAIGKPAWWDKRIDMGPVIEQGTHFCDLSRYFGGDVDMDSVSAHSVEWNEKPGKLSKVPVDESKIPEEARIPRMTTATWKYKNGAVGSFVHAVALQGTAYACELEVYCDGYQMRLVDPYNSPVLYLRRPGDDIEERHAFTDDDPFFSEVSNFVDCIEGGPDPHILSSFEDATKTYEFTWAIRLASEASARRRAETVAQAQAHGLPLE